MRKDVKIGLGIGGVLLAVLIVYLLVPKTNDGTDRVQGDGQATHSTGGESDGAGLPSVAGIPDTGADRDTGLGMYAEPERDAVAQDEPRIGQDTATADAAAERDGPPPPKIDWENVFATGIVPEEARIGMMAQNPPPPDDIFADKTANSGKTGASEPDWSGVRSGPVSPETSPTPQSRSPTASTGSKGAMREHVIQQGENLSMIAAVFYGDGRHYREILKANPTLDERRLKPGTVIKLPDASTFTAARAQPAVAKQEAAIDGTKQYRVQQGDSLHKIALKLYGKAGKADALYEHNRDRIGDDSSRLKPGTVLKLPEPPAVAQSAR